MASLAIVLMTILVLTLGIVFIIFSVRYLLNDDKKDDAMIKPKYRNKK